MGRDIPDDGPPTSGWRRFALVLLAAYVLYYLILSLGVPLSCVVNGLLDDSFYYLQVARNVARGLGSTFDGVELTNGYHPLWLLILVPVYKIFGPGPELPLRMALLVGSLLALGSLFRLWRILDRSSGGWAAAVGLLVFAWPRFFGQTLNLLETSLLLFLYLSFIGFYLPTAQGSTRRQLFLGTILGLACLARLDTVFLVLALGVFGIVQAAQGEGPADVRPESRGRGTIARIWSNVRFLILPAVLVLPYLVWNLSRTGHLQPISGAMKSSFPHPHPDLRCLVAYPDFSFLLLLGAAFAGISLRRSAAPVVKIIGVFGLAALLHMTYTVLFMSWGVDRWHYGLLIPVGLVGLPWLAGQAAWKLRLGVRPRIALLLAGLLVVVGAQAYSLDLRRGRYLEATRHLALWARENLPVESVVATTDAGVFAYFSGLCTINLDGLINNYRYLDELRAGRFREYLIERNVGYILDQYMVGRPDWVSGNYESREYRVWFHPENRVAGQITLFRTDEVRRIDLAVRSTSLSRATEPNSIILWKFRP